MLRDIRARVRPGAPLLMVLLAGCNYWKNEPPVGAGAVVTESKPRIVRLTRADGSRLVLRDARIAHDTLTGLRANGDTMRVAVSEIERLELGKERSALFAVVVFAGVVATLIAVSSWGDEFDFRW